MQRKVVVVGGGYGGSLIAKELDAEADVTLVDPREGFVNAAASLRALTQPDWAPNAFFPFETLLERGRVIRGRAISADPGGVALDSGERIEADYLVLATGSGYPYPAKPNPASTSIAGQLDDLRETHKELDGAGRVLILGAGPVGRTGRGDQGRLAGQARGHRRAGRPGASRLSSRSPRRTMPPARVRINTDYLADGHLSPLTGRATVPVTERLNVQGYEHVYAIGDIAALADPRMASYAMVQAEVAAKNIKAQLGGNRPVTTHASTPERRILLPLGKHAGVGQLPRPTAQPRPRQKRSTSARVPTCSPRASPHGSPTRGGGPDQV